jgi:single-strand DNA-binding protein
MSNVNSVTLSGNLTRDPEQVEGHQIVKFGMANNRRRKNKETEEYEDEVSFFDVTVFGNFADLVMRKLRKGQPVTVQGRLEEQRWETEDGKRSKVVVIAFEIDGPGFYVKDEDVPAIEGQEAMPVEEEAKPKSQNDDDIPF